MASEMLSLLPMKSIWIVSALLMLSACGPRAQEGGAGHGPASGIVGGQTVDLNTNELASSVVFLAIVKHGRTESCTGTFIGDQVILTAAHCLRGLTDEKLNPFNVQDFKQGVHREPSIGVQVFLFREKSGREISTTYSVASFAVHDQFDRVSKGDPNFTEKSFSDIALLKLSAPRNHEVPSAATKPAVIKLASSDPARGAVLLAMGYGFDVYPTGLLSVFKEPTGLGVLREQKFKVKDRLQAARDHELYAPVDSVVVSRPGSSLCLGDSGGPSFIKSGGNWILVGVTSFGIPCDGYAALTSVAQYVNWIRTTANEWRVSLY